MCCSVPLCLCGCVCGRYVCYGCEKKTRKRMKRKQANPSTLRHKTKQKERTSVRLLKFYFALIRRLVSCILLYSSFKYFKLFNQVFSSCSSSCHSKFAMFMIPVVVVKKCPPLLTMYVSVCVYCLWSLILVFTSISGMQARTFSSTNLFCMSLAIVFPIAKQRRRGQKKSIDWLL